MKQQSWFVLIWICLFSLFMYTFSAAAQSNYLYATGAPTFGVSYPIPNGSIDIANGNVHLSIPLGTFKQRGNLPPVSINLEYDSRIWLIQDDNDGTYSWQPSNVSSTMAGWRLTTGVELDLGQAAFTEINKNGTVTCNGQPYTGPYVSFNNYFWDDSEGTMHTFDSQIIHPQGESACAATGTGYAIDGSGYYLKVVNDTQMTVYDPSGNEVYPEIQDANGNTVTLDNNRNVVDSMGRTLITTTYNSNTIQYNVLKEGGGTNTFTIHTEPINVNTFFQQSDVTEFSGSLTTVSSIDLPDGSSYAFTYDSGTSPDNYGELKSMTLPTGGVVSLLYTNYLDSYRNYNRWISFLTENGATTYFSPQVLTQCSYNETGCQEQMTISRPSGDSRVYTLTLNNGAWDVQTDYYTGSPGSSSKLMTTATNYNFSSYQCTDPSICTGAEFIKASTNSVTLDDTGQTTKTQYTYNHPWTAKLDSVQQYDYGATGTPTRETDYTYAYTMNNGISLLTQETQSRNGFPYSQTAYNYEPGGLGNLMSQVSGFTGGSQATTSYTYDNNGMRNSMKDPDGNTTSYVYACNDGFLSQTTYPVTNGISHVTKINPDCSSGLPLSTIDQNNQTTTYGYDSLGRLSAINYPDGGVTTYQYPSATQTVQNKLLTGSTYSTVTTTVDSYGRKSSVTQSDPDGDDTVSYAYDSDGRLSYTYNPQRTSSSPTDGSTFTYYDALDRPTFIDPPGVGAPNRVYLTYSGNSTTVADENGNQKRYVFDAFQDLTQVFEPNATGTPSWETDYSYTTSGTPNYYHVLTITQKGDGSSAARVRTFTYDDLGRTIAESTPEAGEKSYAYDFNGNLTSSTTGLGTLTYSYDAMNRLTQKTGSGISYSYYYDVANHGDSIGRLTHQSNNINAASDFYYDSMGRMISEKYCIPSNCSYSVVTNATYDLAGDLTTLTYPDGRTISQSYDSAQHLTGIQYASWNGSNVGSSYYSATTFTPPGQVTQATYGNVVQMNAAFNSRQNITALSYQTSSQVLWSKQYSWDPNGQNLLKVTDEVNPVQTVNYTYDTNHRLASASQSQGEAATSGSATVTINGGEQSGTTGTYTLGGTTITANMNGQGTDTETSPPQYPSSPSVALGPSDAVTVSASIDFSRQTDNGSDIGKAGANFEYSTNSGSSWTSFYLANPLHSDLGYGPQTKTIGPITGMTNLSQLKLQTIATAIGLGADSAVTITADIGENGPVSATVAGYDAGTLTITVNGHSDTVPFQAGSTTSSLMNALATAINNDGNSPVNATTSYPASLVLTAKTTGASTNYPVSVSWTNNHASFPAPSFTLTAPVALSGGTNSTLNPNALNETYTYDPWGNLQQSGNFNFVQPFTVNNQVSGYSYNAAGDLVNDGAGNSYTYNVEGMLTGANGAQYTYDALDQRAEKTGGGNPGEVIYFAGRPLALLNPSTGAWTDLIWAGNNMIASVAGTQTAVPTYRLVDHLGTLAMVTDNSGNILGTNTMAPYGQTLANNTSDAYPFTGLFQDTEYNGDQALYRSYVAAPGRWLSPDPYSGSYDLSNPQSFNRYMYVGGNPLAFTDPSGLYTWSVCSVNCTYGTWFPPVLGTALSAITFGIDFIDTMGIVLGWWGQPPPFTGNVQASQVGKSVPKNPDQGCGFWHPCTTVNVHDTYPPSPDTTPSGIGPAILAGPTQYPTRMFGTHWCGPGGAGPAIDQLDSACMAHDECYDAHGFGPWSNWDPFQSLKQIQALQQCNQALCDAAARSTDPGSTRVFLFFQQVVPVGACRPF